MNTTGNRVRPATRKKPSSHSAKPGSAIRGTAKRTTAKPKITVTMDSHGPVQSLRESETKLRTLFATMRDAAIVFDADGRCLKITPASGTHRHPATAEMLGKTVSEFFPPEVASFLLEHIRRALKTGERRDVDYSLRLGEQVRWFAATVSPLSSNSVAWVSHEITQRRRCDQDLLESQLQLDRMLRSATDAILVIDVDQRIVSFNPAAEAMFRCPASEAVGHALDRLIPDAFQDQYAKLVADFENSGDTKRPLHGPVLLLSAVRADGERFPAEISMSFLEIKGRRLCTAIIRDVTERKRAEEALRDTEQTYRMLFDSINSGVAIYEAVNDGEDFVIKDFNRAGENIERIKREDIIGKRVTEVFQGVREFGVFEVFQRVWRTGKAEYFSDHIYRDARDPGTWRDSWVYKLPSEEIVALYNDVTERKRAEEEIATLSRFPTENPNPVLRISPAGLLVFANPGSEPLLALWKTRVGQFIPADWRLTIAEVFNSGTTKEIEIACGQRRFDCVFAPIAESGYINVYGRDITDRTRAEEALRESGERFRATFEQAAVGMAHVAPDGHWLRVNQKLCEIVGYTREELLEKTFQQITHPEDVRTGLEALQRLAVGEIENYSTEKRYVRKDGSLIWINLTTSVVRRPSGEPSYFIAVTEDITERKRVEEALRKSEAFNRGLVEASPIGILYLDRDGRITYENPTMGRVMGVPEGAESPVIGKLLFELPPIKEAVGGPELRRVLTGETVAGDVIHYRSLMGAIADLEVYSAPLTDAQGHLDGTLLMILDVTSRKRAEDGLRQSEERFSKVFYASPVAISVTTLAEARFVELNDSFLKLLGQPSREQVIGRSVLELNAGISPEYRASLAQALRAHGRVSNVEAQFDTVTGEKRDVLASLELIELSGQPCILTLAHDITERKRTEQELRAREEEYRRLVTEISDGIFATDDRGVLLFANPALASIHGFEHPDQIVGRNFNEFIAPLYSNASAAYFQRIARGEQPQEAVTLVLVRPDGTQAVVEVRASAQQDGGKVVGTHGVVRDITDRKKAETELVQQLEELRRWHDATLGRETRLLDLKREVNELLGQSGQPPRYPSAESQHPKEL